MFGAAPGRYLPRVLTRGGRALKFGGPAMSNAAHPKSPLRPSVFISYASEDRTAARALRDTLSAAGLDVWYDESELGGGDAWDQKIRRQIRDCDYFMPVVSATTERRKEGYFRREWRLAAERTLDMADDVLFLLPVVIDDTIESGARVPEKFVSVQWLRAPGGQRTPALDALIQRLLAGEHTVAPRPPLITRPTSRAAPTVPPIPAPAAGSHAHVPPPMPAFPHAPEKGGVGPWLKFCAEVLWWAITAIWIVFMRLPRWLRIIFALWLAFALLSTCDRNDSKPKSKDRGDAQPNTADIDRAVNTAAEKVGAAIEKSANAKDWGKVGEEFARRFAKPLLDANAAGKRLVLVPFAANVADPQAAQFAASVFELCRRELETERPDETAVTLVTTETSDAALTALGRNLGASFILGAGVTVENETRTLAVRLIKISGGTIAWQETFPVTAAGASAAAEKIIAAALNEIPARKR